MKKAVSLLILLLLPAGIARGQTWYNHNNFTLTRIDPATGETLSTVGPLVGVASQARGLAISPLTGIAYLEYETFTNQWRFGSVDLATGVVSDVGGHSQRIRDLTFDGTGKLWAVTGRIGANSHSLISVDASTGATVLENGALPIERNKIAYDPGTDTIFLLGWDPGSQAWELYSFSPADPATLTQIALSGTGLDNGDNEQRPGMGFDPQANVLLTELAVGDSGVEQFVMITPGGVVSSTGEPTEQGFSGLDAEPALIFADGFESGDALRWSSTTP